MADLLLQTGALFAGRFLVSGLSAEGGMGRIYAAWDQRAHRQVALKVLHGEGGDERRRFAQECAVLARLVHPALVRYVAHGEAAGAPWLAMAWIQGTPLARRLIGGPLTVDDAVALARRLAEGLAVAHRAGVLHRDVKPANVMLVDDDLARPCLVDFGIARSLDVGRRLTAVGRVVGTWAYLAPERLRGRAEDARADIYSLGVLLYECLTGLRMIDAEVDAGVFARILLEEPPRISDHRDDVPPALDALVRSMVDKAPAARPPSCGALIQALDALEAEAAPWPAAAPIAQAERRVITVVLARGALPTDLTVPLAGGGAPEAEALQAAAASLGLAMECLPDGTALVVVPDEGAPGEQALTAVRCAQAFAALVDPAPVAITTGVATLGRRRPVGPLVDRAAALLDGLGPGAVGVDRVTAGLLGGRLALTRLEGGFTVGPEVASVQPEEDGLPFVGRARELAALADRLEGCGAGRAHAVLVEGPAGVGKSRLVQAFRAQLDPAIAVWRAFGDPTRARSPYGMAAELVRGVLGLGSDDLGALAAAVGERLGPEVQARVGIFLAELVGVSAGDSPLLRAARRDPEVMGEQINRAFLELLSAACAEGPVVLVLEDLHWGGRVIERLVDEALWRLRDQPLLVVAVGRNLAPDLWADHGRTRLPVGGLPRDDALRLARAALGPTAAVEALVARAGGNAFFLEALVRAAADDPTAEALPETVVAMAQAPLRRVPAGARRILRVASVFGGSFWPGGVAAALDAPRGEVERWLPTLVEARLIRRRPGSRFAVEAEWAVRPGLVRDAAYALLAEADRALAHARAAAWLRGVGERDAAALAEHWARGGRAAEAVRWSLVAAERAVGGEDFEGAIEWAARAEALGAVGSDLGVARLVQARATRWLGRDEAAVAHAEAALDLLRRASPRWFAALQMAVTNAAHVGQFARCVALARRLFADDLGPWTDARRHATFAVAASLFHVGEPEAAAAMLAHGEAHLPLLSPSDLLARATFARGLGALMSGDPARALEQWEAAAAQFAEGGELRRARNVAVNVGAMLVTLGDYRAARRALRQVVSDARALRAPSALAFALHNYGVALLGSRRPAEALAPLRRALAAGRARGNARLEGSSLARLAQAALAEGRAGEAARHARGALACDGAAPGARVLGHAILARLALDEYPPGALTHAREAMAIIDAEPVEEGEATARLVHVEALEATGAVGEARAALAVAQARLRDRAAKITMTRWRQTFLAVPHHAVTLAR